MNTTTQPHAASPSTRSTPDAAARRATILALLVAALLMPGAAAAEEPAGRTVAERSDRAGERWADYSRLQVGLMAGLIQPALLGGGNVEADLYYKRLVVGYSHGFNLNLEGDTAVGEVAEQQLALRLPFSTGLGVGVRLLEWLDVRFEAKLHRFEVREDRSEEVSFDYTTATLGAGVYARYRPFYHFGAAARTPSWTHGFVIAPSLRWWPNVWTSLEGDTREYDNRTTGQREVHVAQSAGIANTPIVGNVGVGYVVTF